MAKYRSLCLDYQLNYNRLASSQAWNLLNSRNSAEVLLRMYSLEALSMLLRKTDFPIEGQTISSESVRQYPAQYLPRLFSPRRRGWSGFIEAMIGRRREEYQEAQAIKKEENNLPWLFDARKKCNDLKECFQRKVKVGLGSKNCQLLAGSRS